MVKWCVLLTSEANRTNGTKERTVNLFNQESFWTISELLNTRDYLKNYAPMLESLKGDVDPQLETDRLNRIKAIDTELNTRRRARRATKKMMGK